MLRFTLPLLVILTVSEQQNRIYEEGSKLQTVMDCVRPTERCQNQVTVFREFSQTADAPEAIPALIRAMEREAPRLDNNVCLMLEMIVTNHPATEIPMQPLIAAIQRKVWTSQQKCAQALERTLTPALVGDHGEELIRVLIPLLLSQRSRVFGVGARCLEKITGESFDTDLEKWLAYYEQRYGESIDISDAFYEWVSVVERLESGGYRVDQTVYDDDEALAKGLRRQQAALERAGLTLAIVVRSTEEEIARLLAEPTIAAYAQSQLGRLIQLLRGETPLPLTFSPPQDVFRPPHDLLKAKISP